MDVENFENGIHQNPLRDFPGEVFIREGMRRLLEEAKKIVLLFLVKNIPAATHAEDHEAAV